MDFQGRLRLQGLPPVLAPQDAEQAHGGESTLLRRDEGSEAARALGGFGRPDRSPQRRPAALARPARGLQRGPQKLRQCAGRYLPRGAAQALPSAPPRRGGGLRELFRPGRLGAVRLSGSAALLGGQGGTELEPENLRAFNKSFI